jgi:hypothetical protein
MSNTSTQFEYDSTVLNAIETAEGYQKPLTPKDIQDEKITNVGFAVSWGNYMRTRRSGSFYQYALLQRDEIHATAFLTDKGVVCTCGLIAVGQVEFGDTDLFLWNSSGHIKTSTRELVTVFVVKHFVSKAEGLRCHYWCVSCGDLGATIPTETGGVSLIGLKAIRASHKCGK